MIFYNQLEDNNVEVDGFDLAGGNKHPTYNNKMGFFPGPFLSPFKHVIETSGLNLTFAGAQTDIFQEAGTATPTYIAPSPSSSANSSTAPATA